MIYHWGRHLLTKCRTCPRYCHRPLPTLHEELLHDLRARTRPARSALHPYPAWFAECTAHPATGYNPSSLSYPLSWLSRWSSPTSTLETWTLGRRGLRLRLAVPWKATSFEFPECLVWLGRWVSWFGRRQKLPKTRARYRYTSILSSFVISWNF